jgi:hypothetical protein
VRPGETPKHLPITASEHYLGKLMKAGHSRLDAGADVAVQAAKGREAAAAK